LGGHVDHGGNGLATQHRGKPLGVAHPVLQAQHGGIGLEEGLHRRARRLGVAGLHAEQHQPRAADRLGRVARGQGQASVEILRLQAQASRPHGLDQRRTAHQDDFVPGLVQPGAVVASHRAGSHDGDLHAIPLETVPENGFDRRASPRTDPGAMIGRNASGSGLDTPTERAMSTAPQEPGIGPADDTTIQPYAGPAGGGDALRAVAKAIRVQMSPARSAGALRRVNQPEGFDCPGCAWPDPRHASSFEFCENGAKAVAWEATSKRATPEFFAAHTVSELWEWSDHALENEGRLTHPLAYDATQDKYVPISWEEAAERIGAALRALPDPRMAEFYTSGRASNEAAFLYQLFVREY